MQRRHFAHSLLGLGAAAASSPLWAQASAAPAFREGAHYHRLRQAAPVDAPAGRIEVLEFFAYTCVHCHNLMPAFTAWKRIQAPDVLVRHVPVGFTPEFEPLQRLYYALEALGLLATLHARVFHAIHNERQRLQSADEIATWAQQAGIDRNRFQQAFQSFAVVGRARRATQLQDAYQIEGTPALGIAGRFTIPGQGDRTLQVADALIARVRRG